MTDERTIPAGEFKAKCLKLMDEVRKTGVGLIITRHGNPVARLAPIENAVAGKPKTLYGCMKGSIEILGDMVEPVETGWQDVVAHWDALYGTGTGLDRT